MRRPAIAAKPAPARTPMRCGGGDAGEVRDDLLALGTEGHTDADFATTFGDRAGEDAVEAGGDEREGEKRESAETLERRRWRLRSSLTT